MTIHLISKTRSFQWLVCTNLRLVTSRGIPAWKQYLFTGTEEECIEFFLKMEFGDEEDIVAWLGDFASMEQRNHLAREKYKDFGGYTRGCVTTLWSDGGGWVIMCRH